MKVAYEKLRAGRETEVDSLCSEIEKVNTENEELRGKEESRRLEERNLQPGSKRPRF